MILETTFCIDLLREQTRRIAGPATAKLAGLGTHPLYLPLFVLCELQAGARMSGNPRRELGRVELLSSRLGLLLPDATFPVAYGEAESFLRKRGIPIPTMDLLIGVLAKCHGRPLLTRDASHFARIPGLVVESY